ncbi:MAG: Abi family protein [Selenomonas montiformis]|uniref:Abi family protein n=1 Tax=Selenomonas montiformis TaxID=2652285 RepID=UPI002A44EBE0|nr:Abi family protein [Selenomonadaceae bacterium]MDY4697003.1 Abi family protein [Selenomonas montiformis]
MKKVKLNKPYKTIDEQIEILKKRKIVISRKRFARKVLTYENYYYVINGYKEPFIDSTNGEDVYKKGTSFNEIVALYTFDRRIREILMPELLRVEHSIKAKIIDVFSKHHGEDHTQYLRVESFNAHDFNNFKRTNKLIFDLLKLIDKQQKTHNAVQHYMEKYGSVPLWVLSKVMTFGKINSFYACMNKDDKNEVAEAFGLDPVHFKSLVDYMAVFRNKCAHGERIYCHVKDQKRPSPIKELPIHDRLDVPKNDKGYKYGTKDILALLISMKYFLQADRYCKLIKKIDYALNYKLARRIHTIPCDDIRKVMGLVNDWQRIGKTEL